MTGSGTAHWVDRAILGLLGIIVMLLGAGIAMLSFEHTTFSSLEQIVVVGKTVAHVALGLLLVVEAIAGRLPSWYTEFLRWL